jgi:hypothetical protein
VQSGTPWYGPELQKELNGLQYPLYYTDFETVNPCVPRFAGMRPYDQIPFQWSVHVQRQPGAAPEHIEFLAREGYAFEGVINGVSLEVLIKFGSTPGSYRLLAEGRGANLKGTTNPVTVTLSIGNDMGTAKIHAEFE